MAVYGMDFICCVYATHYIEAKDATEARKIAQRLFENDEFFDDHLRGCFTDIVAENLHGHSVFDGEGMEVTLDADELKKYVV